jgi:hypothetical protein
MSIRAGHRARLVAIRLSAAALAYGLGLSAVQIAPAMRSRQR